MDLNNRGSVQQGIKRHGKPRVVSVPKAMAGWTARTQALMRERVFRFVNGLGTTG